MKTLLRTDWGPLIQYDGKFVHVEDINPHRTTKWQLGRWERFKFGLRLIWSAIV